MDYFEMERRRYSKQGARRGSLGVSGLISPVIKKLIIINLAIFFVQTVLKFFGMDMSKLFGFVPYDFVHRLRVWQVLSYMFLHGGLFHVFWILLALWLFVKDVEDVMISVMSHRIKLKPSAQYLQTPQKHLKEKMEEFCEQEGIERETKEGDSP